MTPLALDRIYEPHGRAEGVRRGRAGKRIVCVIRWMGNTGRAWCVYLYLPARSIFFRRGKVRDDLRSGRRRGDKRDEDRYSPADYGSKS
jgi:hypothetical protein